MTTADFDRWIRSGWSGSFEEWLTLSWAAQQKIASQHLNALKWGKR